MTDFGPAVIFNALLAAGVRFTFVGFITWHAAQLCQEQPPPEVPEPQSHEENLTRLACALVAIGVGSESADGAVRPFAGDPAALMDSDRWFTSPHGSVRVSVRYPLDPRTAGSERDQDPLASAVRIVISTSATVLRQYLATGKYPGLDELVETVELFDSMADLNQDNDE
ncbi:hypothetical protein [Crossiella sp. CA198]|uniref:hypothetical protein n=1 Tax=Crossiella sp. CA198 TaxID=3455607 RepID=UPI003F8D0BB8